MRQECDAIVCLNVPAEFDAVGQFFEDFSQVTDEEVIEILRQLAKRQFKVQCSRFNVPAYHIGALNRGASPPRRQSRVPLIRCCPTLWVRFGITEFYYGGPVTFRGGES